VEIWVDFDGVTKKFTTHPQNAEVKVGTPVLWRFRSNNLSNVARVRWIVSFKNGSPFGDQGSRFTTVSRVSGAQHTGATGSNTADTEGDYKYEVRAEDASKKGETLGEEDPKLKVIA
jgi:hypothetical protein